MHVTSCRACLGRDLELVLDLGQTALANSFLDPHCLSADEPRYPLRLVLCNGCGLVQIDEEVPPEILFRDYVYVSGTSDLVHAHAAELAAHFVDRFRLGRRSLVVEAASNDGTVLQAFRRHGVRVLGVEPARNIAERANAAGVPTVPEFFNLETAGRLRDEHGPANVVLGRHVLAHVADLHGFVGGLHLLLADDGVAVVEFPHLLPFHDRVEFDTIYHEHLSYFSLRVVQNLFHRFGLDVIDVREAAIHGGSLIVTAQRLGGPHWGNCSVDQLLAREEVAGLHRAEAWAGFARRVDDCTSALRDEVGRLRSTGRRVVGYGAPAKGMTLLAASGLGRDDVPYLVDRSPYKQGRLTPGHHIPVVAPDRLLSDRPDVVLILAWNFAAEIIEQQAEYRRRGGRFLLPIPRAHYWSRRTWNQPCHMPVLPA